MVKSLPGHWEEMTMVQCMSVVIPRGNATAVLESCMHTPPTDICSTSFLHFFLFFILDSFIFITQAKN